MSEFVYSDVPLAKFAKHQVASIYKWGYLTSLVIAIILTRALWSNTFYIGSEFF